MPDGSERQPVEVARREADAALVRQVKALTKKLAAASVPGRPETSRKAELDDEALATKIADHKQDIALKKTFGWCLLATLVIQLIVTNSVFVLVGTKTLEYPDSATIQVFVGATMIEVAILIRMILKSLFPEKKS